MNEKCVHEHIGTYGTAHAQRRIRSRSWVCSRLNNCRGRGRGTCFACECTSLSVLSDIREQNRCHALFWTIIKPRANGRVRRCVRFVPYLSTVSIYTHTHDRKF